MCHTEGIVEIPYILRDFCKQTGQELWATFQQNQEAENWSIPMWISLESEAIAAERSVLL